MLQAPDLRPGRIQEVLSDAFGLDAARVEFQPVGDSESAIYRISSHDRSGATYFLKLRRGAQDRVVLEVPRYLKQLSPDTIVAPLRTRSGGPFEGDGFHWMVYPLVKGVDGFTRRLSATQWRLLGRTVAVIHSAQLTADLRALIDTESFSTRHLDALRDLDFVIAGYSPADRVGEDLQRLWRARLGAIRLLTDRTVVLTEKIRSTDPEQVLTHGDLHAGNVLIEREDILTVMDWDDAALAPRERDLMFIGGGVGNTWNTPEEETLFYGGYGPARPDPVALAYYRYSRIVTDLVLFTEAALDVGAGEGERRKAARHMASAFEPGEVIQMADRTWKAAGLA